MTDLRDPRPLSRVELMVLARLAEPKHPTAAEVAKGLAGLGLEAKPPIAERVEAALNALQGRSLANAIAPPSKQSKPRKSRKPPKQARPKPVIHRYVLTEAGRAALRSAFELKGVPSWKDTCGKIVPALALGLSPGSKIATAVIGSVESMTAILLRRDASLGDPLTLAQLADQLIARALGMPPVPVTLGGVRAYALAMHCGVDQKAELTDIVEAYAPSGIAKPPNSDEEIKKRGKYWAQRRLHASLDTKAKRASPSKKMIEALQRYWITQQDEADDARGLVPASWSTHASSSSLSHATAQTTPRSSTADPVLSALRDAIPKVGSDGRYGKENVFVSALWNHLARDPRASELSLERFKRWLVVANRDQLLDLARADLVEMMDTRLVSESEIEDLGATFHFVIDRQALALQQGQVHHA